MKTVIQLGILLGILPVLAIAGVMQLSINYMGARDWSDVVAFVTFGAIYLGFVLLGAYVFSRTR